MHNYVLFLFRPTFLAIVAEEKKGYGVVYCLCGSYSRLSVQTCSHCHPLDTCIRKEAHILLNEIEVGYCLDGQKWNKVKRIIFRLT